MVGLGILGLSLLTVLLPHDPYIRWQSLQGTIFERAKYQYERLNFDETRADVVFIGSSRTAAGIEPALIEELLRERGADLRVVDLSLPASGMDIRLAQAREALQAKPETRLLIISVVEALPRDGHQAFGDLATADEVLNSPLLVNRSLPSHLARLPMRQMKLALASRIPDAFGYQAAFDPRAYPGSIYDHLGGTLEGPGAQYFTAEHSAALLAESNRRKREITLPILPESLAFLEFGVSRSSIEEILDLAADNRTQVVFMFLPFYQGYEEPVDAAWLRERGPLWTAGWMREVPHFYKDAAHASPVVRRELNAWAADRIVDALTAPSTQPQQLQEGQE